MNLSAQLKSKLRHLPARPGVYLMKDAQGEILYVGKAKALRSRVRSYFSAAAPPYLKTRELVRRVADVDTIVVDSEAEALILENNLIKEHHPRFNISLRDDKSYPYIKITTQEAFPRVFVTRRLLRDGARYFGPYTNVRQMRHTLAVVKKLYTVRSCRYNLVDDAPARPCLDFHIGRCKAPCVGLQTAAEYRQMIDEMLEILAGNPALATRRLQAEMAEAAANLQFERAGELRDALANLETLESRQKMSSVSGEDRDVLGFARDGSEGCGVVLRIREGRLLGREMAFLGNLDEDDEQAALAAFAVRIYGPDREGTGEPPRQVLFPQEFADRPLIETLLNGRAATMVRTHVPQRGEKARLVALANQNARHLLEERRAVAAPAARRAPDVLYELQTALGVSAVPRRIVCFDISHTQGTETVAAAVTFDDAEPNRGEYRKFAIRGEWGNDDYRSMQEVVSRYFSRRISEGDPLPDLVLIDGGLGQLNAAVAVLDDLGAGEQPVASIAKREELVYLPGREQPVRLARHSGALRLLQRARDEAHRFAIGYNRKLRQKRTIRSELASVPGVGPARQRALLAAFGSMRGVRAASEEEIARLPGFGEALARTVAAHVATGAGQAGTTS